MIYLWDSTFSILWDTGHLFCYLLVGYLLWNSWKWILTTISKDENHAAISIITYYLTAWFPRSRLTTDSFVKFLMWSYERACRLGLENSFSNRDGKFCHMNTWAWLMGWTQVEFFTTVHSWMALCCFACCIFHFASIPFNYSGIAVRVAKAIMGTNYPQDLRLFSPLKPNWNFSYKPRVKLVTVSGPAWSIGRMWRGP